MISHFVCLFVLNSPSFFPQLPFSTLTWKQLAIPTPSLLSPTAHIIPVCCAPPRPYLAAPRGPSGGTHWARWDAANSITCQCSSLKQVSFSRGSCLLFSPKDPLQKAICQTFLFRTFPSYVLQYGHREKCRAFTLKNDDKRISGSQWESSRGKRSPSNSSGGLILQLLRQVSY